MLILIVFITFIFVFLNFSCLHQFHGGTAIVRYPFINSLLFIASFIVITTELLSAFNMITTSGVLICWIVLFLFSFAIWWKWGRYFPHINFSLQLSRYEKLLSGSLILIILVTLITALVAYPNNWDSMTYHLARVMHWIQNKNVEHYPTQISRQVTQPPLAEYFILHFRLLSDNDRFANLVQWFFMAGSVAVVSLIMLETGKNRRAQLAAAFFTATIPMGILQSSSTQNDYVVSFFIACAVLYLIRIIDYRRKKNDILLFMLACSLAILTKGTALLFLFPIVIVFCCYLLLKLRWRSFKFLPAAILILAITNGPHAWRNFETCGQPAGPSYDLTNSAYGFAPMLSNVSKNFAMHLKTPFPAVNSFTERSVVNFNSMIGINTYSPHYNWEFSPPFQVQYFSTHEDSAGNLLHVLLFIGCFFIYLFIKNLRRDRWATFILLISVSMFLLFSYFLKWQIWHTRLHLPMFVLGAVFIAIVADHLKIYKQYIISILFLLSSLVFLFVNQSRPLALKNNIFNSSAYDQYFINNKKLEKPFTDIGAIIRSGHLKNIGWVTGGDTWEYPMWVMLDGVEGLRMENVMVENETSALASKKDFNSFIPDGIIVTRFSTPHSKTLIYMNRSYRLDYENMNWCFYVKYEDSTFTR